MKTSSSTQILNDFFSNYRGVGDVLLRDVTLSLNCFTAFVTNAKSAPMDPIEGNFWIKTIIRCLMGLVDGISYTMRMSVVSHADVAGISLTKKEIAQLREKKYDREHDKIRVHIPALLPTAESFKLAFRYFPKLFGSEYAIETSGEPWRAFQRLVRVRNGFTHPRCLDDLATMNAASAVVPTLDWVALVYRELLRDIGGRLGITVPDAPGPIATFREREHPLVSVFDENVLASISQSGSQSIEYVRRILEVLHRELRLSLALVKSEGGLLTDSWQFGLRAAARTIFSNIEANIFTCKFFLEAGARRGEVTLSTVEQKSLIEGEVEDRLRSAWNLWSREYGTGYRVPRLGENWKQLRGLRFFRNRITHPKNTASLAGTIKEMDDLIGVLGFIIQHDRATEIDVDKLVRKAGHLEEAIAQEKTDLSDDPEDE